MTYEEFKRRQDIDLAKRRHEKLKKANREYNKGLVKGLGVFGMRLYPLLKRNDT